MMDEDRHLRRKWIVKAENTRMIFTKSSREKSEHVYMKIFLWALYLPTYPTLYIERRIGDRYKPDVVALNATQTPIFWGESGYVNKAKIGSLTRRYRDTHFAIAKWDTNIAPYIDIVREAIKGLKRNAPVDILRFGPGDVERFIDDSGYVNIPLEEIEWVRLST